MKDIIPSYSCVLAKEIDNNFYNNKIYIMFESRYISRKKSIDEAEAIIVGPYIKNQKYIRPNYIGKIKSKGKYNVKYNKANESFEIFISDKFNDIDLNNDINFVNRLKDVHEIQQKFFNEKFDHLSADNKFFFIEVECINPYDNSGMYFKEKKLFYLNEYFNKDGTLIDKFNNFRYFKFDTEKKFFYDIKKEVFILEGTDNEFYFSSPTYRDDLNKLLRYLIKERERLVSNSDVYKLLGIPNIKKTRSDKLNDLKKHINKLFISEIGFNSNIVMNQILRIKGHDGFKIKGDLITNKEFHESSLTKDNV